MQYDVLGLKKKASGFESCLVLPPTSGGNRISLRGMKYTLALLLLKKGHDEYLCQLHSGLRLEISMPETQEYSRVYLMQVDGIFVNLYVLRILLEIISNISKISTK